MKHKVRYSPDAQKVIRMFATMLRIGEAYYRRSIWHDGPWKWPANWLFRETLPDGTVLVRSRAGASLMAVCDDDLLRYGAESVARAFLPEQQGRKPKAPPTSPTEG